jgi:hypothetical protein
MAITSVSHCHNYSTTVAQPPSQPVVTPSKPRGSVYDIITDRIIKQLESGVAPWRKPWSAKLPVNLLSQKAYRGLNVLTLASQRYPSRFWLTFNQANKAERFARVGTARRSSTGTLARNANTRRGTGRRESLNLFSFATRTFSTCLRPKASICLPQLCRKPAPITR